MKNKPSTFQYLQASSMLPVKRVAFFIPNYGHDNKGRVVKIDQEYWAGVGSRLFGEFFGGSTVVNDLMGTFYDKNLNDYTYENTSYLFSYCERPDWEIAKQRIRNYIYKFGNETRQTELMFEVLGELYKISPTVGKWTYK